MTLQFIQKSFARLVEIHYIIGLKDEAKKYAKVLGYNYKSSEWYERSYSVFNEKYKIKNKQIKKEKSFFNKIKSLF